MEDDKFKDLLEDEELKSLRLAALATKRKKEQEANNLNNSTAASLPINRIVTSSASGSTESGANQIPFVQSDRNAFNNNYSWRKQNQLPRRRGGAFPKNTRSNLIVISPVALKDEKNSEEKYPPLVLPQHKWCNSANEDSMSPKTLRKTGPTRFNRHGSDSESSESDYENDDDSESNETVLQDEPAERFSRLSPDSDIMSDTVEKKRRLSFQNLDSDMRLDNFEKGETTSIYNLLKNPSSEHKSDDYSSQNEDKHMLSHSAANDYTSYKPFPTNNQAYASEPLDASKNVVGKQISSIVVSNGDYNESPGAQTWQNTDVKAPNSYYSRGTSSIENSKNFGNSDRNSKNFSENRQLSSETENSNWQHREEYKSERSSRDVTKNASKGFKDDDKEEQYLLEDELKFELKKRLQKMKSHSPEIEKENRRYSVNNAWDRNREENPSEEKARDRNERLSVERNESNLNRTRTWIESSSNKDTRRFSYSSGPESNRCDRSSSQDRSKDGRSASRCRSHRSFSRDRRRKERSSSQGPTRRDHSSSPNRSRRDHSSSPNRSRRGRSFSQEKDRRSSSRYKRRRDYSSSSDSRYERSTSRDSGPRFRRKRQITANKERKKYERSPSWERRRRSSSQERNRRGRSSSRNRSWSRHRSSESRGSPDNYNQTHTKVKTGVDESPKEQDSNQSKNSKYSPRKNIITYNQNNSNQHHNKQISSSQDRDTFIKSSNTFESEKIRENKYEKITVKEESKPPLQRKRSYDSSGEVEKRRTFENHRVNDSNKKRYSRSRSSSSSSYSSSSSSTSCSSRPKIRSISSVVKPVLSRNIDTLKRETIETKSVDKNVNISLSDASSPDKKNNIGHYNKTASFKGGLDMDLKASDTSKRVPVHMRLGVLPRKRVIQMPKDVEAAFVNSSSSSDSESVNTKCKRQNIRIVTDIFDSKREIESEEHFPKEKSTKRSSDLFQEKSKHLKIKR